MGEVKSVKVDNWGVFFLQKLQNFFNKTDYCDLTLQFRDNSQLKVHRLVLSACTDYFNVLEQTCEITDDALIMPNEFQADVVVPIVNFMYTGTLEFELKMYGKLLRTAKEMNMTVLLKLLEAHRRTMENVNRQQRPPSPKGIRRRPVGPISNAVTTQQRVSIATPQVRAPQAQNASAPTTLRRAAELNAQRNTGTTLLRTSVNNRPQYITTESATVSQTIIKQEPQSNSPFEQLRKGYNNNKRPAQTSLLSPPSKKPNLEDVKEFAEQQRMRKQIAAEYGDQDQDYEGMLYDDVHTGDDDDDDLPPQPSTSKQQQTQQQQQQQQITTQSGTQTTQLEHGTTTIILKQDSPSQTPTIIVKDSSNTKLNHTKIIAEVLRQYPHIVKGHKNIKLKILPNAPVEKPGTTTVKRGSPVPVSPVSPHKKLHVSFKSDKSTPMITTPQKGPLRESPSQKPATAIQTLPQTEAANSSAASAAATPQKRRIDSKTMHSLIALGAENTTGPWLCLRCGVNGRPISIPSYRGFRRHLINTHKEAIDAALCEYCGWRSTNNRELHFHMYIEHEIKSLLYTFAECAMCNQAYLTKNELEQHINEAHTDENKQQCIYCNKVFAQELQLYRHMKSNHKAQALEDGIIDETDEEYLGSQDEEDEVVDEQPLEHDEQKVRILSDISLPVASPIVQQTAIEQEEQLLQNTNDQEVKFVGADGVEVDLTEEQRKEILSQLNQQQAGAPSGGVVMVLSEHEGEGKQESDGKSLAGTEEEYDDSQIYNELAEATENNKKHEASDTNAAEESKESIENLEWAENLISEQEMQSEQNNAESKSEKRRDDISEKLKELTGDWSEDENEDEADIEDKPIVSAVAAEVDGKQEEAKIEEAANENAIAETAAADGEQHEDDDIDLALQTLHKGSSGGGDESQECADAEATIHAAASTDTNSQRDSATTDEKMDVDDIINAATATDQKTDEVVTVEKYKDEVNEEFIKEETPDKADEKIDISMPDVTSAAEEDDVNLEAENIRKELLADLIAEAENPVSDDIAGKEADAVEDLVAPAQSLADNTAATDAESEQAAEKNSDFKTPEAIEKPNIEDVVNNKAQVVVSEATSADKVKSFISEWADDDDDDDENGVSAAAKEEL